MVLEFLGAAMTADVYLNGTHLAHHEGGYSTFRVDITEKLQEENLLYVAVDNSNNDRVYTAISPFGKMPARNIRSKHDKPAEQILAVQRVKCYIMHKKSLC